MIEYIENGIRVLEPENDHWLTTGDGYTYSKKVYLGKDASAAEWKETFWDETYPDEDEASDETALTRYANELTGGTDETLTEATETLIKKLWRNEK